MQGSSAMKAQLIEFLRNESGTAAIEYSLFATSISIATITAVQGLGSKLKSAFVLVQNAVN
jgi:pilus assembly protein Flp/PilA